MEYFLDMEKKFSRLENSKYVLIPVPYDGTTTFIKGADKGPQAIVDASDSIELYDIQFDTEAYLQGIHTDQPILALSTPEAMVRAVRERVAHFLSQQKIVGLLGGEHSVSIGAIEATSKHFENVSVLQIDAHADLRDEYQGSIYNHACVMRRAQEFVSNIVQVGIRSVCKEEKKYMVNKNVFYAHELRNNPQWMEEAVENLSENVYLTIDLDGLDSSLLPATGTPIPGGLGWYELLDLLILLFKKRRVVAFDVVELSPHPHDKTSDVLAATLVYKIISLFSLNQ